MIPCGNDSRNPETLRPWNDSRNPETLAVLGKLLKNAVVNPTEEKFRRIRLSNPKIDTLVSACPQTLQGKPAGVINLLLFRCSTVPANGPTRRRICAALAQRRGVQSGLKSARVRAGHRGLKPVCCVGAAGAGRGGDAPSPWVG